MKSQDIGFMMLLQGAQYLHHSHTWVCFFNILFSAVGCEQIREGDFFFFLFFLMRACQLELGGHWKHIHNALKEHAAVKTAPNLWLDAEDGKLSLETKIKAIEAF